MMIGHKQPTASSGAKTSPNPSNESNRTSWGLRRASRRRRPSQSHPGARGRVRKLRLVWGPMAKAERSGGGEQTTKTKNGYMWRSFRFRTDRPTADRSCKNCWPTVFIYGKALRLFPILGAVWSIDSRIAIESCVPQHARVAASKEKKVCNVVRRANLAPSIIAVLVLP